MRRRPLLRTAAVGGVAYAAGSHSAKKSEQQAQTEAQQNAQIAELQQQPAPAAAPPPVAASQQPTATPPVAAPAPSSGIAPEALEQLKQLGELHASNVLTDAEFEAAKQKILSQL
jgi:outer membrane murein-binding lipoprotein Lpp